MADRVLVRAGGMELGEVVSLSLQRLVPTAAVLFLCVFICFPIFHCRGFHVCVFCFFLVGGGEAKLDLQPVVD